MRQDIKSASPLHRLKGFVRSEAVLLISAAAALASAFFVPPSKDYIGYMNFHVLALLFCLMAVVAGIQKAGVLKALSLRLLRRVGHVRQLALVLVLLCFFSSMLITNDVALLTFVPFALIVLECAGLERYILPVVVLQTVAANLGSLLTPVGNPQNLYLYSYYKMTLADFMGVTLPITAVSLVLVSALCLYFPKTHVDVPIGGEHKVDGGGRLWMYGALFVLSLLTVFGLVPYYITLAVTGAVLLVFDRGIYGHINYSLLLTFVCFFVFVGNMGRIEAVRSFISTLLEGREVVVSALLSQVISNVPAAVMLSSFTSDGKALLAGTNIGGLGTLVASLASLISFRIYCQSPHARRGRYLAVFTAVNAGLLVILLAFVTLIK
ncbi:MAG: SLC13 family permease [Eubacteriales bacterium]